MLKKALLSLDLKLTYFKHNLCLKHVNFKSKLSFSIVSVNGFKPPTSECNRRQLVRPCNTVFQPKDSVIGWTATNLLDLLFCQIVHNAHCNSVPSVLTLTT